MKEKKLGHCFDIGEYRFVCIHVYATEINVGYMKGLNQTEFTWDDPSHYCVYEDGPIYDGHYESYGFLGELTISDAQKLFGSLDFISLEPKEYDWYILKRIG